MTWDESVSAVLEDLEQQAAGLRLAERDAEVAERGAAEYSRVALAERVHASLGHEIGVRLAGGRHLTGRLRRCGRDWLLLGEESAEWIVRAEAVVALTGLSPRADRDETWPVADRLSLLSVLRRLAAESAACVVHLVDQHTLRGRVGRVGQDFIELHVGEGSAGSVQAVSLAAVAALQERP